MSYCINLYLFSLKQSLSMNPTLAFICLDNAAWVARPSNLLSAPPLLRVVHTTITTTHAPPSTTVYVGARNSNLDAHACATSNLPG